SPDESGVILRRMLKSSGRGSIFIQSTPVTRAELHDFCTHLFDMHGQHEHQSLLDLENHRTLVDRWAGTEDLAERFHQMYAALASLRERHSKLIGDERERLRRADLLAYAVTEITALKLKAGEEEELEKELAILVHHEKLFTLLEEVHGQVGESAGGVLADLPVHLFQKGEQLLVVDEDRQLFFQLLLLAGLELQRRDLRHRVGEQVRAAKAFALISDKLGMPLPQGREGRIHLVE